MLHTKNIYIKKKAYVNFKIKKLYCFEKIYRKIIT